MLDHEYFNGTSGSPVASEGTNVICPGSGNVFLISSTYANSNYLNLP